MEGWSDWPDGSGHFWLALPNRNWVYICFYNCPSDIDLNGGAIFLSACGKDYYDEQAFKREWPGAKFRKMQPPPNPYLGQGQYHGDVGRWDQI
jgi:hypothetical protein